MYLLVIVVHTSFRQLSKWQLVTLELLILHDEDPEPDLKKIFGYVSMISMFLYLFKLWPARVYYFPCLSIFIFVHRKSKGTVKNQRCLFLIFLFFLGILLKEIRIEFFSILCYFILLKSIRNFVFINLDIFFTSVQKWFLHIQFLSKLMIL